MLRVALVNIRMIGIGSVFRKMMWRIGFNSLCMLFHVMLCLRGSVQNGNVDCKLCFFNMLGLNFEVMF